MVLISTYGLTLHGALVGSYTSALYPLCYCVDQQQLRHLRHWVHGKRKSRNVVARHSPCYVLVRPNICRILWILFFSIILPLLISILACARACCAVLSSVENTCGAGSVVWELVKGHGHRDCHGQPTYKLKLPWLSSHTYSVLNRLINQKWRRCLRNPRRRRSQLWKLLGCKITSEMNFHGYFVAIPTWPLFILFSVITIKFTYFPSDVGSICSTL